MICVWVGGCEKDCNISVCAYFAFVLCMNIVYTSHAGIFRRGCFDLQGGGRVLVHPAWSPIILENSICKQKTLIAHTHTHHEYTLGL